MLIAGNPNDPQGMHVAIADFLEARAVCNYSLMTIEHHWEHLNRLTRWLEERGITRPADVTKAILERYQRHLYYHRKDNGQPLSFRTQHTRLAATRAFFKWLARQHRIAYNPASEIDLPRVEQRLPKHVLNVSEAEKVLSMPDLNTPLGVRDRAIMEVLYSTGIRRMEVVGLRLFDVDMEFGTIMVRQGKGKKDRVTPIGERALRWVEKYSLQVRPRLVLGDDHGALFLTDMGDPINAHSLSTIVSDYIDAADIGKTGSCHIFRHTMATLMLENGADIRHIQLMLGHAKLTTTQVYTQVSIRQLKEIHSRLHPAKTERSRPGQAEPVEERGAV